MARVHPPSASWSPDPDEFADLLFPAGLAARTMPSWLAKKKTVGGFVVEPIETVGDTITRHFPNAARADGLDLQVVHDAVMRAAALVKSKKAMLVFVPVYWNFFDQTRLRTRYLQYLSAVPEQVRRLLIFEFAGIPEDLMVARIEERLNQLRPYCRSIVCRVRLARRDLSVFGRLPVHAVGVDLGELPAHERGIIPAVDAFMDQLEKVKRHSYVHGLTSKSLLIAVQSAGVDFVSGPIIPDADPPDIRDFEIADLYEIPKPETDTAAP